MCRCAGRYYIFAVAYFGPIYFGPCKLAMILNLTITFEFFIIYSAIGTE